MRAALAANLIHKDLAPAARYRIKPRFPQLAKHAFNSEPRDLCKMIELRRREAVQVDFVPALQLAQQPGVIVEREIGMQTTLHQHAAPSKRDHLLDFLKNLLVAVN